MNINWRLVAGIVLLIVVVGYVGFLQAKVGSLERQLETRISVITPEDLKTLRDMVKANRDAVASLERRTDFFGERLTLVGSTLERIATRVAQPGPPGPAGPPGTPASPPGSPLRPPAPIPGSTGMVNPADLVRARLIWPERILLRLDAGHLVECPTAGLDPDSLELLRDPEGRLLSTAPCVSAVNDVIRLTVAPEVKEKSRWKAVVSSSPLSVGAAYEMLPFWIFSLDAVVVAYPTPQVGPGLSASFASNFGVGYGYLYTGTGFVQSAYLTYRP